MNTPSTGPGGNLDSAAKLMLEALSKASLELEKTVNILTEQLQNFNQELEKSFNAEIESARERLEGALRLNLDGLARDKEAVMKTLAEFKQAEIEKIILCGKTIRSGLSAQVEDATRNLSGTVASKITGIKDQLSQPELELKQKHQELQKALLESIQTAQQDLGKSKGIAENQLAVTEKDFENKVSEELAKGQQNFDARMGKHKGELQKQGEQVVSELAVKYDEVVKRLESSYQEGLLGLGKSSQESAGKLKQLSDSGAEFFKEQEESFASSLEGMSGLLNGLFEMRLNNLAAQSRTEIISAANHAEECLDAIKSELQSCLKEFQRDYVAQFEALHSKYEKALDEMSKQGDSGALRGLKEERVKEQLHSLFRRLGQEMIDGASVAAQQIEAEFQKSMDEFADRIETARAQSCETLDRESKLMQKELTKSFQEFEKQIGEMQAQAGQIEKNGRDAANIVMTIRQANLEL